MSALTVALLAAQAELPTALGRDAANESAGYRYMTLDALIAATRSILNAHGLTITQWPTTIERGDHLVPGLHGRLTVTSERSTLFAVGDQVKVVAHDHPWCGAIAQVVAPSEIPWLDWEIELETILPGQRAMAVSRELRRV